MHACIHTHTHIQKHTHIHTYIIHAYIRNRYTHTYTYTYIHTHTYIHTYTHTHIYTHTHTHTQQGDPKSWIFSSLSGIQISLNDAIVIEDAYTLHTRHTHTHFATVTLNHLAADFHTPSIQMAMEFQHSVSADFNSYQGVSWFLLAFLLQPHNDTSIFEDFLANCWSILIQFPVPWKGRIISSSDLLFTVTRNVTQM